MSLDQIAADAAKAVTALGDLTRVPRLLWGTVTSGTPLQVTLLGEVIPLDIGHSAVPAPRVGAECVISSSGTDRWLIAQRPPPTVVPTAGGSTLFLADCGTSGFDPNISPQVAGYASLIASTLNALASRVADVEANFNALRAANVAAGTVA